MLSRTLSATAAAALLLTLVSRDPGAQETPPAKETHETTAGQQANTARSIADREAMAQRFEREAVQFDRQAEEHERLASEYRSLGGAHGWAHKTNAATFASHCDHIAQDLHKSAADAREIARLFRTAARQLDK